MKLNISFPENIHAEQLLKQERIPCLCKISKEFEVFISDAVLEVSGFVSEWGRDELELRAVAGGGGKYTHYANSLITLKRIEANVYKVVGFEMFYANFGWCVVLKDGEYAPPMSFWDEE